MERAWKLPLALILGRKYAKFLFLNFLLSFCYFHVFSLILRNHNSYICLHYLKQSQPVCATTSCWTDIWKYGESLNQKIIFFILYCIILHFYPIILFGLWTEIQISKNIICKQCGQFHIITDGFIFTQHTLLADFLEPFRNVYWNSLGDFPPPLLTLLTYYSTVGSSKLSQRWCQTDT